MKAKEKSQVTKKICCHSALILNLIITIIVDSVLEFKSDHFGYQMVFILSVVGASSADLRGTIHRKSFSDVSVLITYFCCIVLSVVLICFEYAHSYIISSIIVLSIFILEIVTFTTITFYIRNRNKNKKHQ